MCDECCSNMKKYCWKKCHGQIIIGGYDDGKDKHHKRKHSKCHKCRKHTCQCEPVIIFIDHHPCCVECCFCCCCPKKCDSCHSHHPPRHCHHEKQWFEWDESLRGNKIQENRQ